MSRAEPARDSSPRSSLNTLQSANLFFLQEMDALRLHFRFSPMTIDGIKDFSSFYGTVSIWRKKERQRQIVTSSTRMSMHNHLRSPLQVNDFRKHRLKASTTVDVMEAGNGKEKGGGESSGNSREDDIFEMDDEERQEWRKKIREVISMNPDVEEEVDPTERSRQMQKLMADYPLVVDEDDPDWPEDADGWGFNLDQFFNKITIKNVKKDNDDENYDSENEIVWQDDDYIRPIKDITAAEWEETVFKDISPLVVLVHNRYKRPKENEKIRDELEKAVHIIWNCRLPSPRCVAIDAVVELNLVSALQVSVFPELIFTKAGKILHREKAIRTADELSKMMAFFYFGAAKPACLNGIKNMEEDIPSYSSNSP